MDTNTLTTIIHNHLKKNNPEIKRKVVYSEVSVLFRHYGIEKAKKMLFKQHGINESDIHMTIYDLPFK